MRRTIAKWLISRSVDENEPLPGWVQRRMKLDPSLDQYERQCRGLVNRLRSDAGDWLRKESDVKSPFVSRGVSSARTGHFASTAVVVALIAVLLISMIPRDWFQGHEPVGSNPIAAATVTSDQATTVTRFVGAQAALAQRVWHRADALGARVAELRPQPLSAARWVSDQTDQVTQSTGKAVGRTVAMFSGSLRTEQQKWWNSVEPAFRALGGVLPPESTTN